VVTTVIEGVLELRGLRCGDYVVDVWVTTDVAPAITTDELESAVDFAGLAMAACAAVADRTRDSAHAVTAEVERVLLAHSPAINRAQVKVTLA
jgi:dihydroneopterin aldolase